MRDLDVLADLVDRGRAANAATKARAARANEVVIVEQGREDEVLASGDIETYQQLVACIVRILGLAAPIAAQAISPKKVATEDAGQWLSGTDYKSTGRRGWEIYALRDQRLWLYQGEDGRLVQQRRYPGIQRLIEESTYRPDGRMLKETWEVRPANASLEVGPFDVTDEAMPFVRYCGAVATARAFFAFCDRANVLDAVNEGVAKQLAPTEEQ